MSAPKLHANEIDIDKTLAQGLLKQQFPQWAHEPLQLLHPGGTDNVMYRLGSDKVLRLPRMENAAQKIQKEVDWLPHLAPHLPVQIPEIRGKGHPSEAYPFPWLISSWIQGDSPTLDTPSDLEELAKSLAHFISALQDIHHGNGPQSERSQPLINRDPQTREAISLLKGIYDEALLEALWEKALSCPPWTGTPKWIHGDLHSGNILVKNQQLVGILDFGLCGVGDPACDLVAAWTLLTKETRPLFKDILTPDEATWGRAKGWALSFGAVAYPYYKGSNPPLAASAKRTLDEVILEGVL